MKRRRLIYRYEACEGGRGATSIHATCTTTARKKNRSDSMDETSEMENERRDVIVRECNVSYSYVVVRVRVCVMCTWCKSTVTMRDDATWRGAIRWKSERSRLLGRETVEKTIMLFYSFTIRVRYVFTSTLRTVRTIVYTAQYEYGTRVFVRIYKMWKECVLYTIDKRRYNTLRERTRQTEWRNMRKSVYYTI